MSDSFHTLVRDVDDNHMADGDNPEVDTENALVKREMGKKLDKEYIQTEQGNIFTQRPIFDTRYSNTFTAALQFLHRKQARLIRKLQEHLSQMQEKKGLTIPSQDPIKLSILRSLNNNNAPPSAPAPYRKMATAFHFSEYP